MGTKVSGETADSFGRYLIVSLPPLLLLFVPDSM
jgi:hypothetical protein